MLRKLKLTVMGSVLTMGLGFGGCGLVVELPKEQRQDYDFDNRIDAQRVFNGSRINCSSDCPHYVGGLVTYTESVGRYSVGVCSLTLVDDNSVLTNRHCLPDDLKYEGAQCAGRIRVKLPATSGFRAEDFECSHVEFLSPGGSTPEEVRPDYAVLRIRPLAGRGAARLSVAGVPDATRIHLFPVFFNLDTSGPVIQARGTVREVICMTRYQDSRLVAYSHAWSEVLGVSDCTRGIIKGNSGSGMFANGSLVGVLSAGVMSRFDKSEETREGGGANLACIPEFNAQAGASCQRL